jgi:putative hemolysin
MSRTETAESALPHAAPALPRHIVDVLIDERAKEFSGWLLRSEVTGPAVRRIFRYDTAKAMADEIAGLSGERAFDLLAERLALDVRAADFAHVPRDGAAIVIANHPTGLADGIAMWQGLRRIRQDVVFFANADALRVSAHFADIIIPLEWRLGERSPSKSKAALAGALAALAAGKCLVVFPSGIPAIPSPIAIDEQPWLPTFVSLAAKTKAPVIPVAMRASNSALFYFFCFVNKPLRHMSLFREFVNKARTTFAMQALAPQFIEARPSDVRARANELKAAVMAAMRAL